MAADDVTIRIYNELEDKVRVESLQRTCEVGPVGHAFLFTETMGDHICRIRNSPMYNILIAEIRNEVVGVVQGTIKVVTMHEPFKNQAKVGYILGLRVIPCYRRRKIGFRLICSMEEWFVENHVDYSYVATEKDNHASINLFTNKLRYIKFRNPIILVNPVRLHLLPLPSNIEIVKLKVDYAEFLYRKFMGSVEFFPQDIEKILTNKLNLGTWVAYDLRDVNGESSWAMLSVWNSNEIFKLRLGEPTMTCSIYEKASSLLGRVFPSLGTNSLPNFQAGPFGFYFVYGIYKAGPSSRKLVRALFRHVNNMARKDKAGDCKMVVTEVGKHKGMRVGIPYWKLISFQEDLWCIKALGDVDKLTTTKANTKSSTKALFVDPREV